MAAHVPRRFFAVPFVVTVATVATVACNGGPPPAHDPAMTGSDSAGSPTARATVSASASATASATASASASATASATASASARVKPQDDYIGPPDANHPLPPRDDTWTIMKAGGSCTAAPRGDCPEGARCNPPPPWRYACPTQIAHYPATVTRKNGAKECVFRVGEIQDCAPGEDCKPPPPHYVVVPCP